jgi:hypothetical protein
MSQKLDCSYKLQFGIIQITLFGGLLDDISSPRKLTNYQVLHQLPTHKNMLLLFLLYLIHIQ